MEVGPLSQVAAGDEREYECRARVGFFREHDVLVGLSIDGPRALHDAYRVDKGGRPTFDRVLRGLDVLDQHGVEWNVLATVHAANVPHPLEVYRFFRDALGARFIQFIPIVEWARDGRSEDGGPVTARSTTGQQYGDFLTAVFDEWVRRDVGRVFVQLFDVALEAWISLRQAQGSQPSLCIFSPTCGQALALEHNGDLYACDHFVTPAYRLGNVTETPLVELVGSVQQRRFGQDKWDRLPPACRQCPVLFVCHGGCPKNRLGPEPSRRGTPGLNYLCEGYKAFFKHIDAPMRFMADELRAQRPAANVMPHLARQEAALQARLRQAGRNDPCPCGSGKKFKYCHGRAR